MKQKIAYLFFVFLSSPMLYGQSTHHQDSIAAQQYLDKSMNFYESNKDSFIFYLEEKAMPLLKQTENWETYLNCVNILSFLNYKKDDYKALEKYVLLGNEIVQHQGSSPSVAASEALNNLGIFHRLKSNYDQAIQSYQAGLEIQKKVNPSAKAYIRLYQNISVAYRHKGDYDQAISYLEQALQIQKDSSSQKEIAVVKTYLDMGLLYQDKKRFDQAKGYQLRALKDLQVLDMVKNTEVRDYTIFAHQSFAELYFKREVIDSAYYHIQKAISLQSDEFRSRRIRNLEMLGDIYLYKKEYQKAIEAFKSANQYALIDFTDFDKKKDVIARTYTNIADAYLAQDEIDQALSFFQSGLIAQTPGFEEKNNLINPPLEKMISKLQALDIIHGKGKAYFKKYEQTQQLDFLKTAFNNYNFATEIISDLRKSLITKGSKNELAEKAIDIYEGGIKTAYRLYQNEADQKYLEAAWLFAEQNKARLLEESLQEDYARLTSGLPEEALKKEQDLSRELNFYQSKINLEKGRNAEQDESKVKRWSALLFDLENEYNELINQLEQEHPVYYAVKYATKNIGIDKIKKNILHHENALLTYFVGNNQVYLFCMTKQNMAVFEFPNSIKLNQDISQIRNTISKSPFESIDNFQQEHKDFVQTSHRLYQTYLQPAIEQLSKEIEHLIIIPDDILAYLPFEVLLTQASPEDSKSYALKDCDYLMEDFKVSYNYSASLLANHTSWTPTQKLEPFLGIAPTFADPESQSTSRSCTEDQVYSLQCNTGEVQSINQLLGGKTVEGKGATSSSFLSKAQQCRILHLATHACIDEENPELNKIYFAGDYIAGADLNNLKLNAELAVLSACNTGSGKLVKGEGVMSLSRGFILSGCPSTLMSLWAVDDCTTSQIMLGFYQHLKKGLSKDAALRQAKLDHLSTADKVNSHPYYWAAFVHSGNADPMQFSGLLAEYKWLILFLAGLFLYFLFRKKQA